MLKTWKIWTVLDGGYARAWLPGLPCHILTSVPSLSKDFWVVGSGHFRLPGNAPWFSSLHSLHGPAGCTEVPTSTHPISFLLLSLSKSLHAFLLDLCPIASKPGKTYLKIEWGSQAGERQLTWSSANTQGSNISHVLIYNPSVNGW